ncbi:translation initiation factor IF-2-like [Myiozetetes cayanensis]|uniref:translation initiation factor IF-2-like n=1 Tax=Myiozetetes cayanensis TaxID=478635 RepID=UPI002160713B|nr:translation initiation factor IF-2-like [Myiozetetes cayanensis]
MSPGTPPPAGRLPARAPGRGTGQSPLGLLFRGSTGDKRLQSSEERQGRPARPGRDAAPPAPGCSRSAPGRPFPPAAGAFRLRHRLPARAARRADTTATAATSSAAGAPAMPEPRLGGAPPARPGPALRRGGVSVSLPRHSAPRPLSRNGLLSLLPSVPLSLLPALLTAQPLRRPAPSSGNTGLGRSTGYLLPAAPITPTTDGLGAPQACG